MNDPHALFKSWLARPDMPEDLARELREIENDEDAVKDRFWRHLEFGTGGLRGIIGAGTNRMNVYTVGRASQGLADYLRGICGDPSVCIAYDTRHMSKEFASKAAEVFCSNGIRVLMFESVRPTPMLSFAVRLHKANAGIVITASHNPKEYNGYKVYGPDGGQLTDEAAAAVFARIEQADIFVNSPPPVNPDLLSCMGEETDSQYYEKVKSLIIRDKLVAAKAGELKILYSPLHGTGNIPVRRVLDELGFSHLSVVEEQERPDSDFPTVPYPNPEEPAAFALAIEKARTETPDLVFATDPDCDRIGILAREKDGGFSVLSGNQVGALLCDYILSSKRETGISPPNAAVVKTIVTSDLIRVICDFYGAALADTLTGFKYIGEKAGEWEQSGEYIFQFGLEESCGYLSGNFVRDKDAVIAAALAAEMTLYYKEQGLSLSDALQRLYERFGHTKEKLLSYTMPGQDGAARIDTIMENLRTNYKDIFADGDVAVFEDYRCQTRAISEKGTIEKITLPQSNVLKFIFSDKSWLVLRPSGTEPKIKLYLMATGPGGAEVDARLARLVEIADTIMK